MIVGIPQECKNNEYRVSLMPQHIAAIAQTHKVIVQDLKPSGKFLMEDVHRVGGIPAAILGDIGLYYNPISKPLRNSC